MFKIRWWQLSEPGRGRNGRFAVLMREERITVGGEISKRRERKAGYNTVRDGVLVLKELPSSARPRAVIFLLHKERGQEGLDFKGRTRTCRGLNGPLRLSTTSLAIIHEAIASGLPNTRGAWFWLTSWAPYTELETIGRISDN